MAVFRLSQAQRPGNRHAVAVPLAAPEIIPEQSERKDWPFKARRLVNRTEQRAYFRLYEALPDQVVLSQVALSQMVDPDVERSRQKAWRNRIDRLVVDFVVCDSRFQILAVIEIDGPTHRRSDRRDADERKTKSLEAAGYKLIRWDASGIPKGPEIRQQILGCAELNVVGAQGGKPAGSQMMQEVK